MSFGCQFIAGVAGLEATDETAGGGRKKAEGEDCTEDTECTSGFCTDGICCKIDSCTPYACNAKGTACTTTCSGTTGGCAEDAFCDEPPGMTSKCESCGWTPTAGACSTSSCEACSGSLCTTTCDQADECTSSLTLFNQGGTSGRLFCKDQCNNITVRCSGPNPCEIVCEAGGCQNLTLKCDRIGMCKLTCNGDSCAGASILCGGNTCTATCQNPVMVNQSCGVSCDCSKVGCM